MTHITQELAASHTPIDVLSPADGSIVGSAANLTADEVAAAVAGLRAEQPSWEALGIRARRTWLEQYRDWLLDHDKELVTLLQAETAKPSQEARLELALALDLINYYCKRAEAFLADEHPRGHNLITKSKRLTITRHPYPVVGVITPWNVPLLISLVDSAPALLAGAAVVVKPSEVTPLAPLREQWIVARNDRRRIGSRACPAVGERRLDDIGERNAVGQLFVVDKRRRHDAGVGLEVLAGERVAGRGAIAAAERVSGLSGGGRNPASIQRKVD